jgi:ABC-type phosphate/phosphonate transport system substrate-binding protein
VKGAGQFRITVIAAVAIVAAGCSGSPSAPAPPSTSTTGGHTLPATSSVSGAKNLTISAAVRAQLIAAVAAQNGVAPSEYSGLRQGLTFYALDTTTGISWAGAQMVPTPSPNPNQPTQAQVSSQDEGSYYIFEEPQGGPWKVYPTGGTPQLGACTITVPPAILLVWGWPSRTCRAPGS